MQRFFVVCIVIGALILPHSGPAWAGDDAEKMARADSSRAYDAAKRGYWLEALALWENALELDPDDAEILNNYAVGLEATGRYEEAGRVYEKALALEPNSRRIRKNAMLAKDFYVSYVLREEPNQGEEDGDEDQNPPDEEDAPHGNQPEQQQPPDDDDDQGDDDE